MFTKKILKEAEEAVKSGSTLSDAMGKHKEVPAIMVQMIKSWRGDWVTWCDT